MKIIVDFDDVLFSTMEQVLKIFNKKYNRNIQLSNITIYNLYECFPKEDADKIMAIFNWKELYEQLQPLPQAAKCLKQLIDQGYEIYIATATDIFNLQWKAELIKKYFPFISTDNIIRIMDKSLLRADILIDDCLDHLKRTSCEKICLDYPWTKNDDAKFIYDISTAASWVDIINIINNIERKNKELYE